MNEESLRFGLHGELAGDPVGRCTGIRSYIQTSTWNHENEENIDNHG